MGMWASLRKFGLEFCDFPTMLSNVSALLWTQALDIDGRNSKRLPRLHVVLSAVCFIDYIYTYVIPNIMFIFRDNASSAFVAMSLTMSSSIAVIKLFYLMFHGDQLKKLTNKYLACDARIIQGSRYCSNLLKTLRNVKKRGITFWLVVMLNAVVYLAIPFLRPGRHLTLDWYIIYGLDPILESPNYEIALIIMGIAVVFICYTISNITCFLILTIGYNEAHMLSLCKEMINLWQDAVHHYDNYARNETKTQSNKKLTNERVLNKFIEGRLVEIIEQHAFIINNLKEIEDILRGPNAIANLLLIMSLIAELLGGLEHTYLQLNFSMVQLAMDCYLGQRVMDSSEAFERAVYDCNWEMFNISNRKIVLVILQNSQKTMKLSVGGMATLNFMCLMSRIKSIYSAYTTLRSTLK